jgi:hypothetical protein
MNPKLISVLLVLLAEGVTALVAYFRGQIDSEGPQNHDQ